ncbi:MAG: MBL fold metallo-hydrolase, partial [Clostridia bacterium]|nr:MBL fold metallo-hydrolase [Clostridia bacterium]
ILLVAIMVGVCYSFFVYKKQQDIPVDDTGDTTQTPEDPNKPSNPSTPSDPSGTATGSASEISSADLSIHFLELGVHNAGDCVLIKCGNTEVLIDAGAKKAFAPTQRMLDYVASYCTDGVLEYVIATHAHEDHIAGLVGQKKGSTRTGFLYQYKIGTIIQFARNNTTSGVYNDYVDAVKACKANVYTALDCTKGENGAQATYYLDEAQTISMNILYQEYYEKKSSSENNYSVCMLLTQQLGEKQNNYLFTGDLESAGEKSLVKENPNLPHCVLYKGGHHGSSTSSSDELLNKITPENIAICTCAGTYEYAKKPNAVVGEFHPEYALNTFPTQEAIDRMSKHTEKIYITTLGVINEDYSTKEFVSMNGDIVFYYGTGVEETEKRLKLWCSNNTTILKDTEWFKENRTWNGKTTG